ncbi:conserved hypothetical protein [Leishmania major strain Friedlin]|uniref:FCP1 homology domain-containing protein n=1 Tax=Leishmania major TaxID=5664 RepID=E9ACN4_LEIMA|nr:conserved hypothetical protein [Leishmania major strain Friedlin]CAG9567315.1 NLI_interacting_factor-like_phosphatase_-_putative [Leishmania major strain Friedlin]CBZ12051.1 conserved hypothetical protein [Leishmania major strain Friedlin]|eukprot:XP_003721765.1 conserved hypothetical protein [Leishmania major strain Friedlin]
MLADIVKYARWLWDAVLLPYVITSISSLASDGWESFIHLKESVIVLFFFLCGWSHRTFPLSRSAVEAQRSAATAAESTRASARMTQWRYGCVSEGEDNDADSEADVKGARQVSVSVAAASVTEGATASGQCAGEGTSRRDGINDGLPLIQRRLLFGKKGEVEGWMSAVRSRLLVPPHHPLCTSRSLHQLVSIVVGPIQQPTVSTMPTRHPEPQWPPHFLRTSSSGGGTGGSSLLGDPSTDDNSSSNSSAAPHTLRHRTNAAAAARYRQASSVVYKRVSSRNLDFSSSCVAPHLIASITAHHVLSYPATRQKVLVIDLDETLCHVSTTTANMAGPPTFSEVIPTASGAELFHVWERPYARLFLSTAAKLFNLVLFTSASKPYADTILQRIDPDRLLKYRYYRQDCRLVPRGLLRKMCAAAGMRGLPLGSGGAEGRSSVACGSSDCDRSGGGGSGSVAGGGVYGSSSSARPLGRLSSAASIGGRHSGSTTNTDDDVNGSGRGGKGSTRAWGNTLSSEAKVSLLGSGGSAAGDHAMTASVLAGTAADRGGVDTGLPAVEKAAMNEHAKVLVKDLRLLKVPPELLVMIDNSEECTLVNPENALVIPPYIPALSKMAPPARETTRRRGSRGHDEQGSGGGAVEVQPQNSLKISDDDAGGPLEGRTATDASSNVDDSGAGRVQAADDDDITGGSSDDSSAADDIAANDGTEDDEDEVLLALLSLLECLLVVPDVRSILRHGRLY